MISMSDGQLAPANPDAVVQGDSYRFTVLSPGLIRMEWAENGVFVDERSQLVANRDFPVPEFSVTRRPDGSLEIVTENLVVKYDGNQFSSAGLTAILRHGGTDNHYAVWRYGFEYPQRLPMRGNLLGTARTVDLADGAIPLEEGLLTTWGFNAIDDSTTALLATDGWIAQRPGAGSRPRQDIYLFGNGRDYATTIADYLKLTGPIPLVPRFALGNWWSRYWPYSETEYLELMDRFADEQIPLSVSVIDMDWHLVQIDPEIGTGWTGYTWNPELFPDPKRFLDALHERGLAVTLNVHPADGVRHHEQAYAQMAKAMGIDPASELPVPFDITSREFVDAYLRYLHHPIEEQGVDFWWLDWQSGGATNVAGLDPLWMLNHIHYLDSGRDGRRPLTFSRYAGLGSHRYPVGFSGDSVVSWASLDFQPYFTATAANVAFTWWSHDIGGHLFGSKDTELTVRWFQLGVFSPINRLHSTLSPFMTKEPWAFGPRAHQIMARFLRLRHRLIPSLYTASWQAHTDGVSVVRPMYHDYSTTPEAFGVPNEAMLGEHLLLAPITSPEDAAAKLGSVRAWLPEGAWYDLFTGQRYAGGRHVTLHRPLEQSAVLARAGSVLPLAEALEPVSDAPEKLTLRVFPGDGVSHLIEDHGQGAPTAAEQNLTRIVQELVAHDDGSVDLKLVIEPTTGPDPLAERTITVEVVGVQGFAELNLTGGVLEADPSAAAVQSDEILSPALRLPTFSLDAQTGAELLLSDVTWVSGDLGAEAFAILDAAEIPFKVKEAAWEASKNLSGLALAQELTTIAGLPVIVREAILERADG